MDPISIIALATGIVKATGLGELIGGKLGGDKGADVATRIVNTASTVLGAIDDPDEALRRLNESAELRHQVFLAVMQQEKDFEQMAVDDRASARTMQQAALQQEDLFSKHFIYWFAWAWSLFTMGYIAVITLVDIPAGSQRFADTILGFMLGTLIATIMNFFFGSSKQSRQKDDIVQVLTDAMHRRD